MFCLLVVTYIINCMMSIGEGLVLPRFQALADRTTRYINSLHKVFWRDKRAGCGEEILHTSHRPLRAYAACKLFI